MAKGWLDWEIEEEYKEDKVIGQMIGTLKLLRETEETLSHLHIEISRGAKIHNPGTIEDAERKENRLLIMLAKQLRLLMFMVGQDNQFEMKFMRTRKDDGHYNAYPAQRGLGR